MQSFGRSKLRTISLMMVCSAFVIGCSTTPTRQTTKSDFGYWNKSESCNFEAKSGDYSVFGTYYKTVSRQPVCTETTCSYRTQTNRTYLDVKRSANFSFIYDADTTVPREAVRDNFPPAPLKATAQSALKTNPTGDFARFKLSLYPSSNEAQLTLALPSDITWDRATAISPSNKIVFRIQHAGSPPLFERDARISAWMSPLGSDEPAGTYAAFSMRDASVPATILRILSLSDNNVLSIADLETDTIIYRARLPRLSDPKLDVKFVGWEAAFEECSN